MDVLRVPIITCDDDDDLFYCECFGEEEAAEDEDDDEGELRGQGGDWVFVLDANTSSMSTVEPQDSGGGHLLLAMNTSSMSTQE